jgi:cytolysin-activating lysine-acyltransferase
MSVIAPSQNASGDGGTQHPASAAKTPARPRDARQARMGQAFSQVIAVLMRDPAYRQLRLADLEWLVIPPLMCGQFKLAKAPIQQMIGQKSDAAKPQEGGMLVPVAVGLWARVSPRVDKKLSETLDKEVRLQPSEWSSGDHLWLMAVAGDPRAVPHFVKQLAETEFKGQEVKMRLRTAQGSISVKTLT